MESYRADIFATDGETTDVSAVLEGPSVDQPEMGDLAVLLEKDAGWTRDVCSAVLG